MLGDGFHVIIPERGMIAMYPRLAGRIPENEAAALLEACRLATYPVSPEVFRATRTGLVADGIVGAKTLEAIKEARERLAAQH